jgi:hypothetical protein
VLIDVWASQARSNVLIDTSKNAQARANAGGVINIAMVVTIAELGSERRHICAANRRARKLRAYFVKWNCVEPSFHISPTRAMR